MTVQPYQSRTPEAFAHGDLPAWVAFSLQRDPGEAAERFAGRVDHDPHRFKGGDAQEWLAVRRAENDSPGGERAR